MEWCNSMQQSLGMLHNNKAWNSRKSCNKSLMWLTTWYVWYDIKFKTSYSKSCISYRQYRCIFIKINSLIGWFTSSMRSHVSGKIRKQNSFMFYVVVFFFVNYNCTDIIIDESTHNSLGTSIITSNENSEDLILSTGTKSRQILE